MLGTGEFEAIAADTTAGEIARASKHALPLGTPCRNCAAPLQGAWCHVCGQKGEDYHRSIRHLIAEAFEGLTHFDGRFWNTLPRLVLRPGALTRDFLDGKRVSQIPPFRLFLVVLLLVFFAGSVGGGGDHTRPDSGEPGQVMDAPQRQKFETKIAELPGGHWLAERAAHAMQNPESVGQAMEHWSHRFAILTLPLAALVLSLLYAFRRGVYVYDHLIFSMHSLSFQGLLFSSLLLLGHLSNAFWWLVLAAPVHLFVHMRGTYGGGRISTLARMSVLFVLSGVGFGFLMLGLVIVGLVTAH